MSSLRNSGRKALVTFITGGDPNKATTAPALHALVAGGADVIEVGVPFSDPEAEGPAIQKSSERALAAGTPAPSTFSTSSKSSAAEDATTPVLLMGYLNSVERMGYREFVNRAAAAGVDGMIIVNLPPEEASELLELMRARGLELIFLVAPTTTPERIGLIAGTRRRLHLLCRAQGRDRRYASAHRRYCGTDRSHSFAHRPSDHDRFRHQGRHVGAHGGAARRRRGGRYIARHDDGAPSARTAADRFGAARATSGDSYGDRQRMTVRSLDDWLAHAERVHPVGIDMGLVRVRRVAERLDLLPPAAQNVVVAGTNGKGSTSVYLEALLLADGRSVGTTLSPHLSRFNERVRVNGVPVDDATLCDAFATIEEARGETTLTYFEFGVLAALLVFRRARVDTTVLEVGLGGRLDAVNIVDAFGIRHYQHRHRPRWIPRRRSRVDRSRESRHPASRGTVRLR